MLGLVVRVSHALFSVVKNFSLCVSFWLCWSGFSLVAVRGLLISVASPVAEHRLQSSGSAVVAYGLSCSVAYGIFQEPGIKLVFPALAGGFFTTEPPGKVKEAQSCLTLCDPVDCSLRPWDSLGKNTGVGCHFLLQGIFPTQGSNPGLPHCGQTL